MKKIKVLSYSRLQTTIGLLLGLLAGIIYSFGGLIIDALVSLGWITTSETLGLSYGTLLAFGALIGMPLIGGLVGFATGILGAIIYNWLARWMGKVDLNIEK